MYDGYHDDWVRDDAKAIVQAEGCEGCPDIVRCKAEGACVLCMEVNEPDLYGEASTC